MQWLIKYYLLQIWQSYQISSQLWTYYQALFCAGRNDHNIHPCNLIMVITPFRLLNINVVIAYTLKRRTIPWVFPNVVNHPIL